MPAVPSSSESVGTGPVCPHAAKMLSNAANGESGINGDADDVFNGKAGHKLNETNGRHLKSLNGQLMEKSSEVSMDRKWIRPDLPSRCTWKLGDLNTESPHNHYQR